MIIHPNILKLFENIRILPIDLLAIFQGLILTHYLGWTLSVVVIDVKKQGSDKRDKDLQQSGLLSGPN